MITKRHTDFYIPVLRVLEDMKPHEINKLIEEVADLCGLSEEDRKIMTRGETNLKYRSHIQWAVTDLRQGGFISKDERGVYKMSFDGMLMLEENPERPTRDYLYQKSDKFRDFVNRRGTRTKHSGEAGLFEEEPKNSRQNKKSSIQRDSTFQEDERGKGVNSQLKSLYDLRDKMVEMGFNTNEIDEKIELVKSSCCLNKIKPVIRMTLEELSKRGENKYVVVIDNSMGTKPVAYICSDSKKLNSLKNKKQPILDFYDEKLSLQEISSQGNSNSAKSEMDKFSEDNEVKLFDKKVGKSFLNTGVTVARESVNTLERILGYHIEKGKSVDSKVSFNNELFDCRIANVNIQTLTGHCYQIYWKGRPGISNVLNKYFGQSESRANNKKVSFVEFYIDSKTKYILVKPKE